MLAERVQREWKPGDSEAVLRLAEGVLRLDAPPERKRAPVLTVMCCGMLRPSTERCAKCGQREFR